MDRMTDRGREEVNVDGLVQERLDSSALAMELRLW